MKKQQQETTPLSKSNCRVGKITPVNKIKLEKKDKVIIEDTKNRILGDIEK